MMPRIPLLAVIIGSAIIGLVTVIAMLIEDVQTEKEDAEKMRSVEKINRIYLEMKKREQLSIQALPNLGCRKRNVVIVS
jgi:hypothetical protein